MDSLEYINKGKFRDKIRLVYRFKKICESNERCCSGLPSGMVRQVHTDYRMFCYEMMRGCK